MSMQKIKLLASLVVIASILGCSKKPVKQAALIEPSGQIIWTQKGSGVTTADLSGNYSGDKEYFCSSISNVSDNIETGKITWEFLPQTHKFGNIILVRVETADSHNMEYILKDKDYRLIYQDSENKVEYISK